MIPFINKTILTLLILFPLLGAFVLTLSPRIQKDMIKRIALIIFGLELLFSLHLPFHFSNTGITDQFFVEIPWIADWNIFYRLGIDGLSLVLIYLTVILVPLIWWRQHEDRRTAILSLLLTTGFIGTLCSLDLFVFVFFFIFSLSVLFTFTLFQAKSEEREAPQRLLVFTLLSAFTLLTAILILAARCDFSFNLFQLMNYRLPITEQRIILSLFVSGFLISLPLLCLFRTHPLMIFVPVLSLYGMLRIAFPLLPDTLRCVESPLIIVSLAIVAVLLLVIILIRNLVFARRFVTVVALCCLVIVIGCTAKPVWNLIERSAETVLLYMQSERTFIITGEVNRE